MSASSTKTTAFQASARSNQVVSRSSMLVSTVPRSATVRARKGRFSHSATASVKQSAQMTSQILDVLIPTVYVFPTPGGPDLISNVIYVSFLGVVTMKQYDLTSTLAFDEIGRPCCSSCIAIPLGGKCFDGSERRFRYRQVVDAIG
jgi:hypothetical protein